MLELKSTTAWTVSSLREALGNYIRARETAETQSASLSAPQVERNLRTTGPPPRHRMGGEALLNNVRQERPPRCSYCQGQHYPDECTVYNTVEARKSRLGDRCLRCLRRGHAAMDCPFKRMCYYCNKPHHRSLCMRKFPSGEPSLSVHAEPFCCRSTPVLSFLSSSGPTSSAGYMKDTKVSPNADASPFTLSGGRTFRRIFPTLSMPVPSMPNPASSQLNHLFRHPCSTCRGPALPQTSSASPARITCL